MFATGIILVTAIIIVVFYNLYLVSSAVLVIIFVIFFIIFSIYNRKNMEAGELASEIGAISDIYSTMELIDLESGITKPIRSGLDNINALGTKSMGMNATGIKLVLKAWMIGSCRSASERYCVMKPTKSPSQCFYSRPTRQCMKVNSTRVII